MPSRLFFASFLLSAAACCAAGDSQNINYKPEIHGTVRSRLEVSTSCGEYRFQVRNARLSVNGKIASWADYYLNTDLCDRGKMKILDAWARITPAKGATIQAGQFRMPFGVETFRAPHTYLFANRSFMGKQMCNYRAVGIKAGYTLQHAPAGLEAGLFNPSEIGNHTGWHNKLAFAAKAWYKLRNITFTTGYQSIRPDGIRANLIDASVAWFTDRWHIEGEYMYQHYTNSAHKPAHSYVAFADYNMPVKAWVFDRLSFQGRFDGLTAHSSAKTHDGALITDNTARNRITLGATISYIRTKNMFVDIRANYEKYFYHDNTEITPDMGDKTVLELVLRF